MGEGTFWNGEPCDARKVWVVVAEWDEIEDPPEAWWRPFVGQRWAAVEVRRRDSGEVFYLDDEGYAMPAYSEATLAKLAALGFAPGPVPPGRGWAKVTEGRGMPGFGSSDVKVVPQLVVEREDDPPAAKGFSIEVERWRHRHSRRDVDVLGRERSPNGMTRYRWRHSGIEGERPHREFRELFEPLNDAARAVARAVAPCHRRAAG